MSDSVSILMAHNSSGQFDGYDSAPWYLDSLLDEAGIHVSSRTIIDSASEARQMDLPGGWQRRYLPNATSEFDSWSHGLLDVAAGQTRLLCTSGVVKRGVRGGGASIRAAAGSPYPNAPIGRTRWPYWAEGRWFTGYVETSCFTLPPSWPRDWPLVRYRWECLDATFDARHPFGPQCNLPMGLRELAWWWVTYPRSGYSRTRRATRQNMPFIYSKVLAVCNEAVLGVRMVKRMDPRAVVKEEERVHQSLNRMQEVTAASILAPERDARRAQFWGDGRALAKARLWSHSVRLEVSRTAQALRKQS